MKRSQLVNPSPNAKRKDRSLGPSLSAHGCPHLRVILADFQNTLTMRQETYIGQLQETWLLLDVHNVYQRLAYFST